MICSDCDGVLANVADRKYEESGFYIYVYKANSALYDKINDFVFSDKKNGRRLLDAWMVGAITHKQINRILAENFGCDPDYLDESLLRGCREMKFDWNLIGLFQKYREMGLKVFITTDNIDAFSDVTVPTQKLKKYFDKIYNSFSAGMLKIDNNCQLFRNIAEENLLTPAETLILDDNEKIIGAAEKLGFKTYLYNYRTYLDFEKWFLKLQSS